MYLDFPNNETTIPSDYILTHTMKGKKEKKWETHPFNHLIDADFTILMYLCQPRRQIM
jgi:hypothetical protein